MGLTCTFPCGSTRMSITVVDGDSSHDSNTQARPAFGAPLARVNDGGRPARRPERLGAARARAAPFRIKGTNAEPYARPVGSS